MPQELLQFTPTYCIVGIYRLITDESLWKPMWNRSKSTIKKTALFSIPFTLISFPLTKLYVSLILSRSPFSPTSIHDSYILNISPALFTTCVLVLGQLSYILEYLLSRQIIKSKTEAYEATVKSRGKGPEFWSSYVEEWKVPPIESAERNLLRQSFLNRISTGLGRMFILRILLQPLSFIPFLGLLVGAGLQSLTLARRLHAPYFLSKKMTPIEIELFITERSTEYRLFGFTSALLERIPILGIMFSISNRIGAAMWSHDLEKVQHLYKTGELKKEKVYTSRYSAAGGMIEKSDVSDLSGAFPEKKGPAIINRQGIELGLKSGVSSKME